MVIMNLNILKGKKHIHFIGIGGSGMYPLAQILHSWGYYLTGSDNNETETLEAVRKLGIPVMLGQRAENIAGGGSDRPHRSHYGGQSGVDRCQSQRRTGAGAQ